MEMVAALSRAEDAGDVLREFAKGFAKLYGPQGYVSISTRGLRPGEYKITRMLTDDVAEKIGTADPWRDWSRIPVRTGGFLGRVVRTAYPQVLHHLQLDDPERCGRAISGFLSVGAH